MSSCWRSWSRSSEARLLDQLEAAVDASLLRESTELVGRFDVRARADQPHAVPGARARLAARGCTSGSPRRIEQLLRHRLRRASRRAGAALAAGHGVGRQGQGSRLLAAGRAASARQPRAERGREAVRRRPRACSVRSRALRGAEALIGLGEAQRQTGDAGLPRDAAGGGADRVGAGGRRPRRPRGAREQPRLRERGRRRRSSERVAAIERALELDDPPQPARHARLLALLAKELSFEPDRARRAGRWPTRRSRSPARRPIRGRSRRCSKAPATPSGRRTRSPRGPSKFAS